MKTGKTLGGYRIVASLGAGGMGEVWRAEDAKLGREVALKLLPQDVAADADRLARFEREAKVLASLNHPNIAHLYGLQTAEVAQDGGESEIPPSAADLDPNTAGEVVRESEVPPASGPVTFLVMELVEGDDLSDHIARGPIPVVEAVRIARQIAEAVEAAHEQNIVHRDLKPANIKIRPDGAVKVLDFGLAKTWQTDGGDASLSMSPTMTRHATAAGFILGTAAYMSPEQAAGSDVDRRADIWAFGVVLWEMLTGHRLFDGETVSHVLASVLKDQVNLDELPPTLPARLRELIGRCLERDPKRRLQSIGEARILCEDLERDPEGLSRSEALESADPQAAPARASRVPWAIAAVATGLLAIGIGVAVWRGVAAGPDSPRVTRAHVLPPPNTTFALEAYAPGSGVISPDGSRLVFGVTGEDGRRSLWVRQLDELDARPLPGTAGSSYPFWSPDSRHLAFFTDDGSLRKIDTTGGPPVTICSAPNGKGGSWNEHGMILFAPVHNTAIHIASAAGGESREVIEKPDGITSQRFPHWLPNGRFTYLARSAEGPEHDRIMVASINDSGPGRELLAAPSNAVAASGHLLFIREDTLMAQPFDSATAEFIGDAVPVAEDVMYLSAARFGAFSVSQNGVLIYNTGTMVMHGEIAWVDRKGEVTANIGNGDLFFDLKLSPDGRSALVVELESGAGSADIWIFDLERGLRTRFTFDADNDWYPIWTVDGSMVAFANSGSGVGEIWTKEVGGAGVAESVYEEEGNQLFPQFWSPDGAWLVFERVDSQNNADLWALPAAGGDAEALVASSFNESHASISPDGRWMAFVSDESGANEVYVTTFPEPARRWQISTDGGSYPRWGSDGSELYLITAAGDLVANAIDGSGPSLKVGQSTKLFPISLSGVFRYPYDVAPDGERILLVRGAGTENSDPIAVVLNWDAELNRD